MKKTMFLMMVGLIGFASDAGAIYRPGWERPVARADMRILDSRFAFENVVSAEMTLTNRDESRTATGLTLVLTFKGGKTRSMSVAIKDVRSNACGTITYTGEINEMLDDTSRRAGARLHISLTDHRKDICELAVSDIWEAHVREGFGWCGTMDSTLSLSGTPVGVVTPQ